MATHDAYNCSFELTDGDLYLRGNFIMSEIGPLWPEFWAGVRQTSSETLTIHLDDVAELDGPGVVTLEWLRDALQEQGTSVEIVGGSEAIQTVRETFSLDLTARSIEPSRDAFLERVGSRVLHFVRDLLPEFMFLVSDISIWSLVGIFRHKEHRRGEILRQAVLIGVNAVPIVVLISFLTGAVLAIQSAAQLQRFGAESFVVDLVVLSVLREMGPLMTAVMVAGRSGSAITSEVATMKVTEELDALKTMALAPIRYLIVPKMLAAILVMPCLVVIANVAGILGGMTASFFSLNISFPMFLVKMEEVVLLQDIIAGFIKSFCFAAIIVITSSFFGFRVRGGADEVGQTTTRAVVVSITLIIVADSVLALIFY